MCVGPITAFSSIPGANRFETIDPGPVRTYVGFVKEDPKALVVGYLRVARASIENILFSNVIIRSRLVTGYWWGQAEPIHISVAAWHPQATTFGTIRNVRFSNIRAECESGIVVHDSEESQIENLSFHHVLKDSPAQSAYGGNFDLRAAKNPSEGSLPMTSRRCTAVTRRDYELKICEWHGTSRCRTSSTTPYSWKM